MKKIAIVTLYGLENYGNRLQNYALYSILTEMGYGVQSIVGKSYIEYIKDVVKQHIKKRQGKCVLVNREERKRRHYFQQFTKRNIPTKIILSKNGFISKKINNKYDYFIVGSDQVWNPLFWEKENLERCINNFFLLYADDKKKLSYAASFGIDTIEDKYRSCFAKYLRKFKTITVREKTGEIIVKELSNRECDVVLDPTFLIKREEWERLEEGIYTTDKKYILVYFLGLQVKEVHDSIYQLAKSIDADVIDLMDSNCKYYCYGPEVFIELIHKATLCVTDSFHATVFSLIFQTPFTVFNRHHANGSQMNNRIETVLKMLGMENRISEANNCKLELECDFTRCMTILPEEIERSKTTLAELFA